MESRGKVIMKYSLAFKQKVVMEIEGGKLSISEAQKLYNIKGGWTIQRWIKKMGKNELLNKVVKIELSDEVNMLKQRERENRELESALAQAHLKIMSLEKMLEVAGREYGEDFKKKYDTKA
ncbi:MAG: transposase [Ignavibacteriaceae bacterium]